MGFDAIVHEVMEKSRSSNWHDAVREWEVVGVDDIDEPDGTCLCGNEGCRYLFSIRNIVTGATIHPIGSVCIKKLSNTDMTEDVDCWKATFKMADTAAVLGHDRTISIVRDKDLFSRKLLGFFYDNGVFKPSKYNGYNGEHDCDFMIDMFNKRKPLTFRQEAKADAIVKYQIYPFLRKVWMERMGVNSRQADNGFKSLPTTWRGIRFRSRTEARWAVYFECLCIDWEYEPEGFELDDGTCYLPDFLLHGICGRNGYMLDSSSALERSAYADDRFGLVDGDVYVEVKGKMRDDDYAKCSLFSRHRPLYVVGNMPYDGDPLALSGNALNGPYGWVYYNSYFIDDDEFGLSLAVGVDGLPKLVSDDGGGWAPTSDLTHEAYEIAARCRFDHGDLPDESRIRECRKNINRIRTKTKTQR